MPNIEEITDDLLRRWPLPQPDSDGDKEGRGRVLLVGGSAQMPGAVALAGVAALRAGAGKLRIAAPGSIALAVGAIVPECRVFALPESDAGEIAAEAAETLSELAAAVDAVGIGPGLIDDEAAASLGKILLTAGKPTVVDAAAMGGVGNKSRSSDAPPPIITPHAGEMAHLLGRDKDEIERDRAGIAREAAERFGAVVVLKGAETLIAAPDGRLYVNRAGNVGLGTCGSGDTLTGIVAGLLARGAEPAQAAVWAVALHARAGDMLAERHGTLGYLARELPEPIPYLMARLA